MAQSAAAKPVANRSSGSASVPRSLDTEIQYVKGVGPRLAEVLGKLGIRTARDLLVHFPRRYEDRTHFARIASLEHGETATILGTVIGADNVQTRGRLVLTKVVVDDGSG